MVITIQALATLKDCDGFTLKRFKTVEYKTGYQVADYGYSTTSVEECYEYVKLFNGNCGIWFEKGVYMIDNSFRVKTLRQAMEIGRKHNQECILRWRDKELIWC